MNTRQITKEVTKLVVANLQKQSKLKQLKLQLKQMKQQITQMEKTIKKKIIGNDNKRADKWLTRKCTSYNC